jgi:hypothetical protein
MLSEQQKTSEDIFTLPISGKTVELDDVKKADGHLLMKARAMADENMSAGIYVLSKLCKINGKQLTADEILDLDLEDVVYLEQLYIDSKKKLISIQKT